MHIETIEDDTTVTFVIKDDFIMEYMTDFNKKVIAVARDITKDIALDLSNVYYIDSAGMGGIISLYHVQKKKGKKLTIDKFSDEVKNIININVFSELFNL
ncbi:MAG: STAS domain-containing protein [bacterium]|nr:STAS domain-containing protein [bacterium]